jgi:hypothetical protein
MSTKGRLNSFFLNDQKVSEDFFADQNQATSVDLEITVNVSVDLKNPTTYPNGFVDKDKLDATTEAQIRQHAKEDDDQAELDALNTNA